MEMLIMFSGGINSIASSLGHLEGDTYILSEYCEDVLEEMLENLKHENKATRPVRINIANSKVLEGDLLHILSASMDNVEVFQAIVRLLVSLSMPLEVILPMHPNMTKGDWEQRHTLQEMLLKIKKHFVQEAAIQAILKEMNTQIEQHGPYPMDKDSKELLNDCLVLIRNILHVEETAGMDSNTQIVRHMLNNGIGDLVHAMLSREEAEIWICAMVQVIRLMFRDQMSQDLVKRATKLHEKGNLFQMVSKENGDGGTIPEKNSCGKTTIDLQSPQKSLGKSSLPEAQDCKLPSESGSVEDSCGGNARYDAGCDSGFAQDCVKSDAESPANGFSETSLTETESSHYSHSCPREFPSPMSSSYEDSSRLLPVDFVALNRSSSPTKEDSTGSCSSGTNEDKKRNVEQQSNAEMYPSSSRTHFPVDELPSPMDLSAEESSPSKSPSPFGFSESSPISSGKQSPQNLDTGLVSSTKAAGKKASKKETLEQKEYFCKMGGGSRGSPESQIWEEDDSCSHTSGNGSIISRSSDNSSSSSTGSSETGSFLSSISQDGTPSKKELLKNQLCAFAVRFCQYGLNRCIHLCQDDLLQHVNDCYVLWCMSYFLPFSSLPCVSYSNIRNSLSSMLVSHLMFATLNTWEEFTMAANAASRGSKSNILFRRLYLLIASLRQILTTTRKFMEQELGEDERESLNNFIKCLCQLEGLRKLYLLLLRKFHPKNESIQYLRALVISNDELLRIITSEQTYAISGIKHFNCKEHLKQFATRQVLLTYNELLRKFSSNSLEENEAVFTLMYHMAINFNNHKLVYQLSILDTFADLWEQGPKDCISQSSWDFMDHIVAVFAQNSLDDPDLVLEHMSDTTNKKRKHKTVDDPDEDLSPSKKLMITKGGLCIPSFLSSSSEDEAVEVQHITDIKNIKNCIKALTIKGYKPQIRNLQKLLLETCYAKLDCPKTDIVEPVVWLNHIQMKSVPLLAFSQADELAMNDVHFQLILQQLGMHSAGDSQQHMYPTIPAFWTAEMCYSYAKMLGDVNFDKLRFALTPEGELCPEFLEMQVESITYDPSRQDECDREVLPKEKPSTSRISNQVSSLPKNMWLSIVQTLNAEKEGKE